MQKPIKKALAGVMAFIFVAGYAVPASAEVTLEQLLQRVEKLEESHAKLEQANARLESENSSLKSEVASLKEKQSSQGDKIAAVQSAPSVTLPAQDGNVLQTKFKTKLYGYIKADAVFNDSTAGTVNFYPISETTTKNNDNFAMAANETRLGLDIEAPAMDDGGVLSGKIEGDFWASTNTASSFRLRQAYAKLAYLRWDVLAGQAWDFFSPLVPNTLNFGIGWNSGNLGDRHVQMVLSNKVVDDFLGGKLSTKVGVVDSNLANQNISGFPVSGALAQYDGKVLDILTTLYVSGIIGRLENTTGTKYEDSLYAGTSGLTLKLTDRLSFKGEGYVGSGLSSFRSAGFDSDAVDNGNKGIDSRGGFAELIVKPTNKLESNTGLGVDVITSPLTSSSSAWKRNNMYYTNLKYSLTKDLLVGIEYQYFKANFANDTEGDDNRVQTSAMYKF